MRGSYRLLCSFVLFFFFFFFPFFAGCVSLLFFLLVLPVPAGLILSYLFAEAGGGNDVSTLNNMEHYK